jgi:DNA-binding LacI/PurR family transcriptional regulator
MRVGVLVDRPIEYGPNCTLRALEAAARLKGYAVSAFAVEDDEDLRIAEGLDNLLTQGIDALCVIAPRSASLAALREILPPLPTVVIQASPDSLMLTAAVDQRAGAVLAVEHLLALGHRRILHVAGPPDWLDAQARADGWRHAIAAAGLPESPMIVGDWTSDFGYRVGSEHAVIDEVTAVFAGNDEMALGLFHGLHVRGLRVPDDISVVGFDDAPDSRHFLPPLTTVRQDFHELGTVAMRLLMEAIANPDAQSKPELITPSLVIRSSTAPV